MTRKYVTGTPYERVMQQVVERGDCLIYTGGVNDHGYGRLSIESGRRNLLAHRIVIEHHRGPSTLQVRHLCHNPRCVRIEHLVYGTSWENTVDSLDAGHYDKKSTKEQRTVMCKMHVDGMSLQQIANHFELGTTTVHYHVTCGRAHDE